MTSIPTLDIRDFTRDRVNFVEALGNAYRRYGFCAISHHSISQALIDQAYRDFQQFFALPVATKMRYHVPGIRGSRGYTPYKLETAKNASLADLKEFYHFGREIPDDSPLRAFMPTNVWPPEAETGIKDFQKHSYALFEAFDQLGQTILQALALHINLPLDFFTKMVSQGNSILRPLHYPPILDDNIPNLRAQAHEDIDFITLLIGASSEGLELIDFSEDPSGQHTEQHGQWLPITPAPGVIVINIGDMLQRLTNNVYKSTTHRVVNPKDPVKARQPRYSVPYFMHPNPDTDLTPLPQCVTAENPLHYHDRLTAYEYLQQRLEEIKLK